MSYEPINALEDALHERIAEMVKHEARIWTRTHFGYSVERCDQVMADFDFDAAAAIEGESIVEALALSIEQHIQAKDPSAYWIPKAATPEEATAHHAKRTAARIIAEFELAGGMPAMFPPRMPYTSNSITVSTDPVPAMGSSDDESI